MATLIASSEASGLSTPALPQLQQPVARDARVNVGPAEASLPEVKAPSVTAPVKLPESGTPSSPAPSAPPVRSPGIPSAPAAPSLGGSPIGGGGGGISTPSVGSAIGSAAGGHGGSGASGGSGGSGAGASGVQAGAAGGSWAAAERSPQARRRRAARRRASVRRRKAFSLDVGRLTPCFGAISRLERGVLVLRAGLGQYRPHSRRATAGRLGVPVRTVIRSERRGLRGLKRADEKTGCGLAGGGARGLRIANGTFLPASTAPAIAHTGLAWARSPMLVSLFGSSFDAAADRSPGRESSQDSVDVAGVAAASSFDDDKAAASDGGSRLALTLALCLMAALMAAVTLGRGWRLADAVRRRRSEAAEARRHEQLKAAVLGILDRRQ